jgi:hypothetical protein
MRATHLPTLFRVCAPYLPTPHHRCCCSLAARRPHHRSTTGSCRCCLACCRQHSTPTRCHCYPCPSSSPLPSPFSRPPRSPCFVIASLCRCPQCHMYSPMAIVAADTSQHTHQSEPCFEGAKLVSDTCYPRAAYALQVQVYHKVYYIFTKCGRHLLARNICMLLMPDTRAM